MRLDTIAANKLLWVVEAPKSALGNLLTQLTTDCYLKGLMKLCFVSNAIAHSLCQTVP